MNRNISIGFGVFALILTAMLLIPRFVDLNVWKPELQIMASEKLGRPVEIRGDVSLIILPYPGITLSEVSVGNAPWAKEKQMISVDDITVTVSLLPLVTKTLEFSQISLVRPRIFLAENSAGEKNWDFVQSLLLTPKVVTKKNGGLKVGNWNISPAVPRVNIQQGTLSIKQGEQGYTVSDFNFSLKSNAVMGPYALKGGLSVFDKDIEFKIDVQEYSSTTSIPVDIQLLFDKNKLQVVGKYNFPQTLFTGQLASKLNPSQLLGVMSPFTSDVTLTGDLNASKDQMKLSKFTISHKNAKISGEAEINLAKINTYKILMTNLPGETSLHLAGPFKYFTEPEGILEINARNAAAFFDWIPINIEAAKLWKELNFSTPFKVSGNKYTLNAVSLNIDEGELKGQLDIDSSDVQFNMETPKLHAWVSLFDPKAKPTQLSTANLKGSISLGDSLELDSRLSLEKGYIQAKGSIWPEPLKFELALDFSQPNLTAFLNAFRAIPGQESLGSLNGHVLVSGNRETLQFTQLDGHYRPAKQDLSIHGHGNLDLSKAKPFLQAELEMGSINGADFLTPQTVATKSGKNANPDLKIEPWSDRDLGLNCLNLLDAKILLKIAQLQHQDTYFSALSLPLNLNNGLLMAAPILGQFNGGDLEASFELDATQLPKITTSIKSTGFEIKSLTGTSNLQATLQSQGASVASLVSNLNGQVLFTGNHFQLSGIDASKIESLMQTKQISELLKLLKGSSKGTTQLDQVSLQGQVSGGILQVEKLTITGPELIGDGSGRMNLNQQNLNLVLKLLFKNIEMAPPFLVNLTGSIYEPKSKLDLSQLTSFLVHLSGKNNP